MKTPFLEAYDAHFEDVYRYVRWKTPSHWEADDIVSDVFRKALEFYPKLRDETNIKAWLFTIARNTVFDFYRKKRPTVSPDDIELIANDEPLDDRAIKDEELTCLEKALEQLDEEDKEAISLRYFAELKFDDIGQILGKKGDAVKVKNHRILKKLGILIRLCMDGVGKYE